MLVALAASVAQPTRTASTCTWRRRWARTVAARHRQAQLTFERKFARRGDRGHRRATHAPLRQRRLGVLSFRGNLTSPIHSHGGHGLLSMESIGGPLTCEADTPCLVFCDRSYELVRPGQSPCCKRRFSDESRPHDRLLRLYFALGSAPPHKPVARPCDTDHSDVNPSWFPLLGVCQIADTGDGRPVSLRRCAALLDMKMPGVTRDLVTHRSCASYFRCAYISAPRLFYVDVPLTSLRRICDVALPSTSSLLPRTLVRLGATSGVVLALCRDGGMPLGCPPYGAVLSLAASSCCT